MTASTDVILYGLNIRSEVPVPGRAAPAGTPPDLEIFYGPAVPPQEAPPEGHVLAHHKLAPDKWYTFARLPDGSFLLRIANVCDFLVDAELRQAQVRAVSGGLSRLVPVFAAGALPSFVLIMKGQPILHASAVDIGGKVLAFMGSSGMGKSTMATLCCAVGGRLVTDDVLRLTTGPGPRCYLGPQELRLRALADEITADFSEKPAVAATGDGRSAVRALVSPDELLPLAAIVVPQPNRQVAAPVVNRLRAADGLISLLQFPRIVGWEDRPTQAEQFQLLATINEAVPIFTARIPWGPPFPGGVALALMEALGLDAPLLTA